jgi:diguanylate cyclase (GGDEF)-like protein/PAS domain S-box-containing protein
MIEPIVAFLSCGIVVNESEKREGPMIHERPERFAGIPAANDGASPRSIVIVEPEAALLARVLERMSDAVIVADGEGRLVLINEAARRLFGGELATAWDLASEGVCLPDRETPCAVEDLPLVRALRGEVVHDSEVFVRSEEEPQGRWLSVNATPLFDAGGRLCGAVSVGRDLTDRHEARSELQQLALTDALTGAYNRRGFMGVARDALDGAHRSGRRPALFFFDLNGMKSVNDSLGHPEGDRLLTDVTSILRSCFRSSDVIGRLGGDEFVVLAPDAGEHAEVLRARVQAAVETFNEGSSRPYRVSVSIGLCADDPGRPARLEELVEQADKRMYEEKVRRAARRHSAKVPRVTLDGAHQESKRARSRHRP